MSLSAVVRYFLRPLFRHEEDKHQRKGDRDTAQFCRLLQLPRCGISLLSYRHIWQPVERYIQMYFKLRFSIQREVYLRAKHDMLYEASTKVPSTSVDEMQTYKKELRSLRETNCNLERETYRCLNTLPDGPLGRILYAHQQQKDWYLSSFLRQECARSGGCCGRECGCCEKPRTDKHPLHKSHCTSMCLCCEDARGYPVEVEKYENNPMIVDVFLCGYRNFSRVYLRYWVNAYVFGFE
ncbi:uncharacterized protein BO88DRAFT_470189 [Aspergillus vadensis CBS 113365]|uniref:Uncharacterized protein n=1 Tax=Aspergillus vadensis (strain CBS 113365 / IMI 142717 / IBT 24658) TaxID=1448311 RepID=A0A319CBK9_ASPVC|nr:hypothetical protein BO88DRAFT_470189 [Aspergillus vadensis CBS 113365]PYH65902.1 hypothetical protein BO88DRAFT_470189 [Aspergillus vadensis CBS 113365]